MNNSKEIEILKEIRNSEKISEEILQKAENEKESILYDARKTSSELLNKKKDEIIKLNKKKLEIFMNDLQLIKDGKKKQGKVEAMKVKSKAKKNIDKAVNYILKKFEESI